MTNFNKFFKEVKSGKHVNKLFISFIGSDKFVLVPKRHLDRYINDTNVSIIIDGANGNLIQGDEK